MPSRPGPHLSSALLVCAALLCLYPGRAQAQTAPLAAASQQQLDCVKVLLAQERAWNAGDIDSYAKAYKNSPDILFVGRQVSRGYDQIVADYHGNYPNAATMGTLSFSELEVHALDENFAVVLGKYHLERGKKSGGNAEGLFTLTMEKTDQGWKIVVDHTT